MFSSRASSGESVDAGEMGEMQDDDGCEEPRSCDELLQEYNSRGEGVDAFW